MTLQTLKTKAAKQTKTNGHSLYRWTHNLAGNTAYTHCLKCGGAVVVKTPEATSAGVDIMEGSLLGGTC